MAKHRKQKQKKKKKQRVRKAYYALLRALFVPQHPWDV
jgi:hypothetical protein